jgi:predicted CXXCH cytochrome family protein
MPGLEKPLRWVAFVAVAVSIASFAATSSAQSISGSAHDFSAAGWNGTGEICVVCHTPHAADTSVTDAPLWNHETTTAVYTLYTSATLDAAPGQPDGVSKLCLSCHDGTIAVDNFGGVTTGTQTIDLINPAVDVTTDLSDDHPVSFTYDAALATPPEQLFDPTTAPSGLGGTIDADLLFGAKVECASCHDVHDAGFPSLLVMDNTASALCLTCHDK